MKSKPKINFILVQSFPTNSYILQPLIDYLSEYFNLYFIDLPGFTNKLKPLEKINIDQYGSFLDQKITDLNLKSYIIGGISFGFLVVNQAKLNKNCQAILAVEPFIGTSTIKLSKLVRLGLFLVIKLINVLNLSQLIWRLGLFKQILLKLGVPKTSFKYILEEIDPKTFFQTAQIIFDSKMIKNFHQLPHLLVINLDDDALDAKAIIQIFKDKASHLGVIETDIPHYPQELNKEYMKKMFSEKKIEEIYKFVQS
jgi:hypothetical protein